jgi:microcystin-dependent protein
VTVNIQQLPTHLHAVQASSDVTQATSTPLAANTVLAPALNLYGDPASLTPLLPASISSVGGSQPHNNMMPYLVLNFIIALQGIFPSQN